MQLVLLVNSKKLMCQAGAEKFQSSTKKNRWDRCPVGEIVEVEGSVYCDFFKTG
jgi:hypothetical protein